jgi:hypothetical protein
MRNFIIFFEEKEGTSPLIRLLDNFDDIAIVHQVAESGWEPFDNHNCGPMSLSSLKQCLDLVLNKAPLDIEQVNQIYTRTATKPLEKINNNGVVGFKMRFVPPKPYLYIKSFSFWNRVSRRLFKYRSFRKMMFDLLKKNDVAVFFAVRQDILKWALSKYHGDGTGKSGHIQFKLARGKISKDELGKIHVDCKRFEQIVRQCKKSHVRKRSLLEEFKASGIQVYPLLYENFLSDKQKYFQEMFNVLGIETSIEDIKAAINQGAFFNKVHSNNISDFIENHEEVMEKFGNCFIPWS